MIFIKGSPVTSCIGAKAVGIVTGALLFEKIDNERINLAFAETFGLLLPNLAYGGFFQEFQSYPLHFQELCWKHVWVASFAKPKRWNHWVWHPIL